MRPGFQQFFMRAARSEDGVALLEFMLVFPIIMLMLFGALEVSRAMLITQRTEKAGYVMADVASQYIPASGDRLGGELSETELRTNVFPLLTRMMGIYADPSKQAVILSSVRMEGGVKRVKWQIAGGGTLTQDVASVVNGLSPSAIGPAVKNQPTSFAPEVEAQLVGMAQGENLLVAEVFYFYEPIWTSVIQATPTSFSTGEIATVAREKLLVKRMYFRPRSGDLICLPGSFTYPECITAPSGGGTGGAGGGAVTCRPSECLVTGAGWVGVPCGGCVQSGQTYSNTNCRQYRCQGGTSAVIGTLSNCPTSASCF